MKKFFGSLFLIIGIALIAGGVYLDYLSQPQNVFKTMLKGVNSKVELVLKKNKDTFLRDNFTTTSKIKFNVKSEYFDALAQQDPEYFAYSNLIKNLNNSESTLVISQDRDDEKLLADFTSNLNNEELLKFKYFLESDKQYLFINKVFDTYIAGDENTYFKAMEDSLSPEDLQYLYETTEKSLENNLKDEYFTSSNEKSLYKVTFKLTEDIAKELLKAIVKDLQEDSKANKMITSISPDFFKNMEDNFKENENTSSKNKDVTLDSDSTNTSYDFNIYTDSFTYKLKKYEIVYLQNNKESGSISYEVGKDKDLVTIKEDGKATGYMEVTKENDNYKLNILDKDKKSLATGNVVFTELKTELTINYKQDENSINFSYKSETKNKNDKGFDNDITASLKISSEDINLIDGTVTINNKVTKDKPEINENVSNATKMTEQQAEALEQKITEIMNRLVS